ncbi:MAG TPA: GH25 family lysozyme [Thermoanaerobaculia bacterium]
MSHQQGTVDWNRLAMQGFGFAFIKATEGSSLTDPEFISNWSGAKAAGLVRGACHSYSPGSDPQQQAEHFLDTVWPGGGQLAPGDLPPVLYLWTIGGQSAGEVVQDIQRWLSLVSQRTQRIPILSTSPEVWAGLETTQFGNYPLWVTQSGAAAPALPASWQQWRFWQYSTGGSVDGIGTEASLDVFQGGLGSLQRIASSASMT